MANAAPGAPGDTGRGSPRILSWVLACLVIGGLVVAVVALTGGEDAPGTVAGGDAAGARQNSASCTPSEGRTSICPRNARFDAVEYTKHGRTYPLCAMFASQADAQAVLRADPSMVGPATIDLNRDGIACPQLAGPTDFTPVQAVLKRFRCRASDPRSARCPQAGRTFDPEQNLLSQADEFDCDDYARQADAQAVLRFQPQDPNRLDGEDGREDGIACPDLPGPKNLKPVGVRAAS